MNVARSIIVVSVRRVEVGVPKGESRKVIAWVVVKFSSPKR